MFRFTNQIKIPTLPDHYTRLHLVGFGKLTIGQTKDVGWTKADQQVNKLFATAII